MIGDVSRAEHIYIVCGYTDMRKAIDGLAAIIQQNFKLDVFSGSLFLFCGKRCDRIKGIIRCFTEPVADPSGIHTAAEAVLLSADFIPTKH